MKPLSKKLTCDIENVQKSLESTRDPIAAMSGIISQMTATVKRLYPLWEKLTNGCLHLHSYHYHNVGNDMHHVSDTRTVGKACVLSSDKGNIDTLMSEQNSFTDLNQTGMIFGRDYAFENNIDLPRYFRSMFNPEVNEYSTDMLAYIRTFEEFLDKALRELYLDKTLCGMISVGGTISNTLILEYFKERDLNNDNKIYGIDFIIDDNKAPIELIQLNKSNNLDLPKISWDVYLDSLKQKETIDMNKCQISPFTRTELIDELIDEFLTCVDQNGDGLIYGKDFIIVSDDRPTQLNQYLPLYLPNIVTTWVSYVKSREYNQPNNSLKYETLLKDEYLQDKDLDGNGLIYGVDFIITDFDCFSNSILSDINDNILGLPIFTIAAYNNTISPYIENYVLDENIQAAKFNAEWRDKVDIDGNGLVYGRDFILNDYEGNKTECLWTIEKYRNFSLSWTPEKIAALKLIDMISDYTQFEFDQYWSCAGGSDGPSVPDDPGVPPPDDLPIINYDCNSSMTPLIPLDFNSIDLSDHIILYNGVYWFDLGVGDINYYSGTFMIPDGSTIILSSLELNYTFDLFTDSSIYYIKTTRLFTSDDPYIFKIKNDGRKRVYPSERFFSVVDSCLVLNETTISDIEQLQESKNYIITSDDRVDKTKPFNQDLSYFMIRWIYNHETETGKWVLSDYYESLLNRVILIDDVECKNQICVPSYKQSSEFKHFLPFILNVSWNDI